MSKFIKIVQVIKAMKHTLTITIILLITFLISQVVGLFIIDKYMIVNAQGEIEFKALPFGQERPDLNPTTAFIYIVIAVLLGTAIAFGLIKFKLFKLWKFWFFLAVLICLTFALSPFMNQWIALVIAGVLGLIKIYKPNVIVHNLTELFIYSGIAVILVPLMNIFAGIMMLILISLYDYWAVFHSKHMISLAKAQSQSNVFAGLYIPYGDKISFNMGNGIGKERESSDKSTNGKKNKIETTKAKQNVAKTAKKDQGRTAILGGGDIAFSLIFAGIVLKDVGFFKSLIIPLFCAAGLAYIFIKGNKGKFYPAMPFVTAGCLIGYGIILLL